MRIIVASQSQFRKKAFATLGLEFETVPSNFDEDSIQDGDPKELARKLAEAKARTVGEHHEAIILSGDLFIVFEGNIYGKPKDEIEAFEMLKTISGNEFEILSGVAVYNSKNQNMLSTVEVTKVRFREMSDEEINKYISSYPVCKFAAAFDGDGMLRFAEHVEGAFVFTAGWPMNRVILFLREQGVDV